jgi:ATP-binding cassette, subfamily G (WHITE), eye pigment precursor transporter
VEDTLYRLNLKSCENTIFGSSLQPGLSGGEKKRTSIAYELISSPSLLILDEPTSAVDSFTALTILELLKKEADGGATIVFTIH